MNLSIVIPTYNSENHLKLTVEELLKFLPTINALFEIVIVNDGSIDNTKNICKKLKNRYPSIIKIYNLDRNHGQKISTLIGLNKSSGKYIITFDDDLQYNVEDIKTLYQEISGSDNWLIVSTKYNYESPQKNYNKIRRLSLYIVGLFYKKYLDVNYFSSFKAYNIELLRNLNLENVYQFWKIPINKISYISLTKKDGIRAGTSYTVFNRIRIFSGILNKMLSIIISLLIVPLSLIVSLYYPELWKILIILILLYIFTLIFTLFEKNRYKRIKAK